MKNKNLSLLRGKTGVTESELNPGGSVQIDGEVYEARTDGEYVEQGRSVKVIRVKGRKIFVVRV